MATYLLLQEFLKKHTPDTLRWVCLTHPFHAPLDFNESVIEQAEQALFTASLNFLSHKIRLAKKKMRKITKFKKVGG